ncbi:hypothetical protein HOD61_02845 [archaeon]|jgi:hypothetical protein|nr:hypothetical protein [archaeon]
MGKYKQHDKGLDEILKREIFKEIEQIQTIAKETQFYRGKNLVAEPDGLIMSQGTLYIVEYKCHDSNRDKAVRQLEVADNYIKNDLGIYIPTKLLYCHDNTCIEEIK